MTIITGYILYTLGRGRWPSLLISNITAGWLLVFNVNINYDHNIIYAVRHGRMWDFRAVLKIILNFESYQCNAMMDLTFSFVTSTSEQKSWLTFLTVCRILPLLTVALYIKRARRWARLILTPDKVVLIYYYSEFMAINPALPVCPTFEYISAH